MSKWAFITGASSGIGEAISYELAAKGYDLIIHGRNKVNLNELKQKLETKYKIKTQTIIQDLSEDHAFPTIKHLIKNKEIDILVNNAGFGMMGEFEKIDIDQELQMVKVHITFVLEITKYIVNEMKKRNMGHILNVSSLYAFFPVPKQAVYSASKSFLHSFSLSLYEELAHTGVWTSSLCPGLTYSKFRTRQGKKEKEIVIGMSSEAVAKIAIVKMFQNKPIIVPGLFNKLMRFTIPKLPIKMSLKIIHKMNKQRGF